jgi:hypothetical protein
VTVAAAADYVKFYELPPRESRDGIRTWYARGQNFMVAYSETEPDTVLSRANQPDEYTLLLPDPATRVDIVTPRERVRVEGNSLTIVPPGESTILIGTGGRVVRVLTSRSTDMADLCANADSYSSPHANVARFEPWPDPPGGYRIRSYSLDVPSEPGRFGRIFRCSTMMINWLEPSSGPRDVTQMTPHAHPDFEQCSLVLEGEYVHHLRWPWTTNLLDWRDDDHQVCRSPSVTVIPPTSIHTSQAIGQGTNQLIDIFCPPRLDFSQKPGWVLNTKDYPI